MSEIAFDLNDIIDVREVTTDILHVIAEKSRLSSSWEQMVYRESEIDQVWRLIDQPQPPTDLHPHILTRLRAHIMEIHDLIGAEHRSQDAARLLADVLDG